MPATFKQMLSGGDLVRVFSAGRIVHPAVFDVFGFVGGFHGFWLDQEHAGTTCEQVVLASACARANGFDFFVRMPMINYSHATQNLEAGAGGLMAARVDTVEDAREFLSWVKFAPDGNRGLNGGGRDAEYGGKPLPRFAADSNRDTFVAIQIETLGSLEASADIAALPGVDLLFVGPSDLSQSLGILGQFEHEKLWEAYRHVAEGCRRHSKPWATIAISPSLADRALSLGCRMLSVSMDIVYLRKGIEATKQSFGKLFGG
jgi:4-hydroxy-2-oxoheptanedioate aldolase